MAIDDHGKERPVSDMIHQRIGDYDAFTEYQTAVFALVADGVVRWLDTLLSASGQ